MCLCYLHTTGKFLSSRFVPDYVKSSEVLLRCYCQVYCHVYCHVYCQVTPGRVTCKAHFKEGHILSESVEGNTVSQIHLLSSLYWIAYCLDTSQGAKTVPTTLLSLRGRVVLWNSSILAWLLLRVFPHQRPPWLFLCSSIPAPNTPHYLRIRRRRWPLWTSTSPLSSVFLPETPYYLSKLSWNGCKVEMKRVHFWKVENIDCF